MRAWRGEATEGFEGHLKEGCYHYDGEDEDAEGFEAAAADGVVFVIAGAAGDEERSCPDDKCGEEV